MFNLVYVLENQKVPMMIIINTVRTSDSVTRVWCCMILITGDSMWSASRGPKQRLGTPACHYLLFITLFTSFEKPVL